MQSPDFPNQVMISYNFFLAAVVLLYNLVLRYENEAKEILCHHMYLTSPHVCITFQRTADKRLHVLFLH